jgi:hypothetical protein
MSRLANRASGSGPVRWRHVASFLIVLLGLALGSCKRGPEPGSSPNARASTGAVAPRASPAPAPRAAPSAARSSESARTGCRFPAAARIVAFGDVHGDLGATRAALKLAGAVNDQDEWVGGDLVVVQTGDQLDRGDDDRAILDLFDALTRKARAAGGAFHVLNGNHETMNVSGDFRHATLAAMQAFSDIVATGELAQAITRFPESQRGRAAAFLPGGVYARRLAEHNAVIIVGDTVFVHGGIVPAHVRRGLDRINSDIQAWMRGERVVPRDLVTSPESPVWLRIYSAGDPTEAACAMLEQALSALRAKRMVVGHTIQEGGINPGCDGRVWRIDVGMSAHYGGQVAVLEIEGDRVRAMPADAN